MNNNQPFLNEEKDFFKSKRLDERGTVKENDLMKAIPVIENNSGPKEIAKPKAPSKEFTKFKKEIEGAFKIINDTMKEMVTESDDPARYSKLLMFCKEFKKEFEYRLNDKVQGYDTKKPEKDKESPWNKRRINLTY